MYTVLLTESIVMQEVVCDKQVTVIWNLKEGVGSLYILLHVIKINGMRW